MQKSENVNYSYWEFDQYFDKIDLLIIGSGIVGLSTAISFKQKHKQARVIVLERGTLPSGASTKNAGFACFGSPSELLDDLGKTTENKVWDTVSMRWDGLQLLRKRVGDKNMDLKLLGGYELFDDKVLFETCLEKLTYLNKNAQQAIGLKNTYSDVSSKVTRFGKTKGVILNQHEGQINTGMMMNSLLQIATALNVKILNGVTVKKIDDLKSKTLVHTDKGIFSSLKVVVATNGFATQLLKIKDVNPARAQVIITKPIKNLKVKGTFHYQQGYFYFRNIDNRILFGGGRNLDFKGETTTEMGQTKKIQNKLDQILKEVILPGVPYEIEHRWSGIMGVGSEKKPIIEFYSPNVLAAIRMGGMGVAIGSIVGEIAAKKIHQS